MEPGVPPPAWEEFVARHGIGDLVDGRMTKVLPSGAFIRAAGAIDGLLVGEDRPEVGAKVSVRIATSTMRSGD